MRTARRVRHLVLLVTASSCGLANEHEQRPTWLRETYLVVDPNREETIVGPTVEHYVFGEDSVRWERFESCDSGPVRIEVPLRFAAIEAEHILLEQPTTPFAAYPYGSVEVWPVDCGRLGAKNTSSSDHHSFVLWEVRSCEELGIEGGPACGDIPCEHPVAFLPELCP